MFKRISILFWLCCIFFVQHRSVAQNSNIPYSILGLGRPVYAQNVRSMGMGGLQASTGNALYNNFTNPALLSYNKLTTFAGGYLGKYKQLKEGNKQQTSSDARLSYLNLAFPLTKRWTMSLGLRPLTLVNYNISKLEKIPHRPTFVQYQFEGFGGLSQVSLSSGYHLWKGLSLGLELRYIFGKISSNSKSILHGGVNDYAVGTFEETTYSKIHWKLGVAYSASLNEKHSLDFGFSYRPTAKLSASSLRSYQRRTITDIKIRVDTLNYVKNNHEIYPSAYSLGFSFRHKHKFLAGIEYAAQYWSEYANKVGKHPLADGYKISTGFEWTPDYKSVSSYWKRVTMRAGFAYEKLPWQFAGESIEDRKVTAGLSFPLMRYFSSISMVVEYGNLDGKSPEIIKENYLHFGLGLTINDRWFIKRKIN